MTFLERSIGWMVKFLLGSPKYLLLQGENDWLKEETVSNLIKKVCEMVVKTFT